MTSSVSWSGCHESSSVRDRARLVRGRGGLARAGSGRAKGGEEAGKWLKGTDRFGDPVPIETLARFGTTRLWHAPGRHRVEAIALPSDGRLIASAGTDLPVMLWDSATGREVFRLGAETPAPEDPFGLGEEQNPAKGHNELFALAYSPNGMTMASAGRDNSVR